MATPRWAQWDEKRDAANHPDGNEDVFNRAMMDWLTNFRVGHNDDGTHILSGFLVIEEDTYTGLGTGQTVSLTNSNLDIMFLFICRADTEYPVFISADMSNTKEIGTNAFQALITDIATTGEFTVNSDAAVDAVGVTYYYLALGTEA